MKKSERKRNRNAIRSVNMIMEAYVKLLMKLPADKITVTAIVNEAGLNRSTFYAHFGCPADVHELFGEKLAEELLERIEGLNLEDVINDPKALLDEVSQLIIEREEYVKLMFDHNRAEHWMDRLNEAVIDKFMADVYESELYADSHMLMINLRFFVGGYVSLCRDYLSGRIDKPLLELTEVLAQTISGGLKAWSKKDKKI